ncbi:MAG: DNA-methyltransferase [Thermodesulfovibrionales bacterium]
MKKLDGKYTRFYMKNLMGETLMNKTMINKIIFGDALKVLPQIKDNSIDLVLTDPPYFLDKMDNNWNHKIVSTITDYCNVVKSLPPGMKFDKQQGKNFYDWYLKVSKELYRVLKPGGFFFSFSSPRLYHRMVSAVDDAGFSIRDCFIWLYTQNQPKAMSLNHFIDRLDWDKKSKEEIKEKLAGWKTPQIKSCFEPIMVAQKPCEKTFLENMLKYNVGLINTNVKIGEGMFPSNVVTTQEITEVLDKCFLLPKPTKEEKGEFNIHRTVKPLAICEYIIKLTTFSESAIVLDPFVGSGTTAVAAKKLGRKFIGIDINPEYVEIALKRLENTEKDKIYKNSKAKKQFTLFEPESKYSAIKKLG